MVDEAPTADVVPRETVDEIAEELSDTIVEKDQLFDMVVKQRATIEQIFEEIEKKVKRSVVIYLEEINKEHIKGTPLYDRCSGIIFALRNLEDFLAELKNKYIGEQNDDR